MMDTELVIPKTIITCKQPPIKIGITKKPPFLKAANLDTKSIFLLKNTNKNKTELVETEINIDKTPIIANLRAQYLNEVIDLWSDLSKIPLPKCKCTRNKKLLKIK